MFAITLTNANSRLSTSLGKEDITLFSQIRNSFIRKSRIQEFCFFSNNSKKNKLLILATNSEGQNLPK